MSTCLEQYEYLRDYLNELEPESDNFAETFEEIKSLAINGTIEAAGLVAEISAFEKRYYSPETAYFFYNISMREEGFSLSFNNLSSDPAYYLGVEGDFRNEPQVSDLITILGINKCRELDAKADQWRLIYNGS